MTTVAVGSGYADEDMAQGALFEVSLDAPVAQDLVIAYRTVNGTARAGKDFQATRSTVTIPAGEQEAYFLIPVIDDNVAEKTPRVGDEHFFVALRAPRGVTLADRKVKGVINDEDFIPQVSFADVEGDGGARAVTMTAMLSNPSNVPIRVTWESDSNYGFAPGNHAEPDVDFKPARGKITFRPGATVVQFRVTFLGDAKPEPDEDFYVFPADVINGGDAGGGGGITIVNDD